MQNSRQHWIPRSLLCICSSSIGPLKKVSSAFLWTTEHLAKLLRLFLIRPTHWVTDILKEGGPRIYEQHAVQTPCLLRAVISDGISAKFNCGLKKKLKEASCIFWGGAEGISILRNVVCNQFSNPKTREPDMVETCHSSTWEAEEGRSRMRPASLGYSERPQFIKVIKAKCEGTSTV